MNKLVALGITSALFTPTALAGGTFMVPLSTTVNVETVCEIKNGMVAGAVAYSPIKKVTSYTSASQTIYCNKGANPTMSIEGFSAFGSPEESSGAKLEIFTGKVLLSASLNLDAFITRETSTVSDSDTQYAGATKIKHALDISVESLDKLNWGTEARAYYGVVLVNVSF